VPGSLAAHDISKSYAAVQVLDRVSLVVAPGDRVGVVGPNGIGKSTLLRVLAGIEPADAGGVVRSGEVGYLPQEPDALPCERVLAYLARRTGVGAAEDALDALAARLGSEPELAGAYADALDRFLALGGDDFAGRARASLVDVGLAGSGEREVATLSGGEAARVALASILLARFDVFLLDEPTNNLDFAGLERLERFVSSLAAGVVLVSHDRAFLDRTVNRIVEIEPETRKVREYAGTWSEYEAARERARAQHERDYADYVGERERLSSLLAARRQQAESLGGARKLARKTGGADRRATNALRGKVAQARHHLEQLEEVEKPWTPWRLQLRFAAPAPTSAIVSLHEAVVEVGAFRLGPVSLDVRYGDRLAIVGRNGAGKTTLLRALRGELPLASGSRDVAAGAVFGELNQARDLFAGVLLDDFVERSGLTPGAARTLLAKFALGADDVVRPAARLSPGERTRAALALLSARGVNCLALDEPTNHLDLEAIEELERALEPYQGALVVVSHDRRFLERLALERTLALRSWTSCGAARAVAAAVCPGGHGGSSRVLALSQATSRSDEHSWPTGPCPGSEPGHVCPSGARGSSQRGSRSDLSAAHRGSACSSSCACGSSFRFLPHSLQSPAQSSRQRIWSGSSSATASRAHCETSRFPPSTYCVVSWSSSGDSAWYSRARIGISSTTSPRQR